MFLYRSYTGDNDDNIIITKYVVEHDLENDIYALFLYDVEEKEVDYFEFINYDEVYKYVGQLRFSYLERFTFN